MFLLEAYFAWDWFGQLNSRSGWYWLGLYSCCRWTVPGCWKNRLVGKSSHGIQPCRTAGFQEWDSQKSKRKHEGKRLPVSFDLVSSRINSSFHWYPNRISYTHYYTITAFPWPECVLACIVHFTEACQDIPFRRSSLKVLGVKCLIK